MPVLTKEQYAASYLQRMKAYPDYVASCLAFYKKTYGESSHDQIVKLMAGSKK